MAGQDQRLKAGRWLLAVVAGLALSSIPFLRYVHTGDPAGAHADHSPHHGGRLQMVGDHHLELIRHRGRAMIYISDAFRQPIQPRSGWLSRQDARQSPLRWDGQRMWAEDVPATGSLRVEVTLEDGTVLRWTFGAAE